ncbi:MAG: hypothetical protein M1376_05145 [Planctomycetes bacterium]|nr:hypothetical protein [Planctomycetota bacterium]
MTSDRTRRYPKAARHASSAALLAVGVLALYNWVLAPQVGYLRAVQRLGPVVGRVTHERERICGTLDGKVSQWRNLQRVQAELQEGVFTVEQAKAFARGLLSVVEETGCTVLRADFNPDVNTQRLDEPNLPVVIEVSRMTLDVLGPLDRVSALLQQLRDSRPRAWIDSCQCDFSGGDGFPNAMNRVWGPEAGQVECNLALALYTVGERYYVRVIQGKEEDAGKDPGGR